MRIAPHVIDYAQAGVAGADPEAASEVLGGEQVRELALLTDDAAVAHMRLNDRRW